MIMNNERQVSALQDLIIRLQDSEKGYLEIKKATRFVDLKEKMQERADERHEMHRKLETHVRSLGHSAEVKTSILGELHRTLIDLKVNHFADTYESISAEINRGAETLISDYDKVFEDVVLDPTIRKTLVDQQKAIEQELASISTLKTCFALEPVS
jgi:uncharacterized protein (TIGR02284 family)